MSWSERRLGTPQADTDTDTDDVWKRPKDMMKKLIRRKDNSGLDGVVTPGSPAVEDEVTASGDAGSGGTVLPRNIQYENRSDDDQRKSGGFSPQCLRTDSLVENNIEKRDINTDTFDSSQSIEELNISNKHESTNMTDTVMKCVDSKGELDSKGKLSSFIGQDSAHETSVTKFDSDEDASNDFDFHKDEFEEQALRQSFSRELKYQDLMEALREFLADFLGYLVKVSPSVHLTEIVHMLLDIELLHFNMFC